MDAGAGDAEERAVLAVGRRNGGHCRAQQHDECGHRRLRSAAPAPPARPPRPPLAHRLAAAAAVDGVMSLGVTVAGSDTPASQYETMFLRSLVKNLVVYGTRRPPRCLFRGCVSVAHAPPPAPPPRRSRPRPAAIRRYGYTNYRRLTSDDSEEHVYQVPGGDESAVRFDPDELAWIADHRSDSSDPKLAEITADEAPFSTIVLMPPLETRPDGYGSRAFRDAERIEAMLENHSRRDAHNSMPGVFTFVDNDAFQVRFPLLLPPGGSTASPWCGNPAHPGARRAAAQGGRAG